MTNEQAVMQMRINLMNAGVIGTTGKKMNILDNDGQEIQIDEPAPIHTIGRWNKEGYKVKKGQRAKVFIPIWTYVTNPDGSVSSFSRNAAFFTPDQVEVSDFVRDENKEVVEA